MKPYVPRNMDKYNLLKKPPKPPKKDTRPSRTPEARAKNYAENREKILEQHAIQRNKNNQARREMYKEGNSKGKHKPVIVRFSDVDLPIEITLTEYQKYKKTYFEMGADVMVRGERVVEQLELL
jgi:hypothetical protein